MGEGMRNKKIQGYRECNIQREDTLSLATTSIQ